MTAPATREEVLADIRAAAEELDRPPSLAEYREREAGLSEQPAYRIFGSWTAAVEAAGLDPRERDDREKPTEDELREHYHDEGMTTEEIGERYGFSAGAVQLWMEEHGIERRSDGRGSSANPLLSDREWLEDMLATELTYEEIASEAGAGSASAVHYWIRQHELEGRRAGDRPRDDELRQLYEDRGMTLAEIAEEHGVATSTAQRWTEDAGIQKRGNDSGPSPDSPAPCEDPPGQDGLPDWLDEGSFHAAADEASTAEEMAEILGWGDPCDLERLADDLGAPLADDGRQRGTSKYASMFKKLTGKEGFEVR